MFNNVMKYVERRRGPSHPGANAVFHYPEMFLKFRDEYTESMIRKIVEENAQNSISAVDVYMGNWHVSPVSRLWNTNLSANSSN